jgi:hypothetical protein
MPKQYSYKDVPTIKAFAEDNTFIRGLMGCFGSGKSSGCVIEIVKRAMAQVPDSDGVRRTKWAVVRNTFPQLRDSTIPTFLNWCQELGQYKSSEYEFHMTELTAPDGSPVHALVCFRALDRPGDIRNLLSVEYTGAWFNEAREIDEEVVNTMRGRIGRFPPRNADGSGGPTWAGIFMDTNPPNVDSWWYKLFETNKPTRCSKCRTAVGGYVLTVNGICPDCKGTDSVPMAVIFKQPSGFSKDAENLLHLPSDYYQNLAAGQDQDFINVYCHGQYGYTRDGKPVYVNYDPSWHYSKEVINYKPGIPVILSFDNTGLNQACVAMQFMPGGQARVIQEWLLEDMGTRRLVHDFILPYVWGTYTGSQIFITGDPAGVRRSDTDERTTFQEIQDAFKVEPIPASSNAWQARYSAVDSLLMKRLGNNEPGLVISNNCKMLHRGFMGEYRFRRLQSVGGKRYIDKPEKNMVANVHDALQYGCMFIEDFYNLTRRNIGVPDTIVEPQTWAAYT